ncbi:MAG: hypothetical protein WHS63_05325 [Tenuifilum sp.]|uniref:hypothetical protein n=1 Tax=Tenuifilum sp. TaxID=2760880 RepID=UPI0030AE84D3
MLGLIRIKPFYIALGLFALATQAFAQYSPAGIGNATGTNGQPKLVMWLDASSLGLNDNDPIDTWTDKSGNGNNATAPSAGQRPLFKTNYLNGLPAVQFNATNSNILNFDGNILVGTDLTATFVSARRVNGYQLFVGGTRSEANRNMHIGWRDNTTQFLCNHWGNDIWTDVNGFAGSGINSFGIFTNRLASAEAAPQRRLFQNGQEIGNISDPSQLLSYEGAGLASWTGTYYNVDIAEVIFYTKALNAAQQIILNTYLSAKYNITLNDGTNYFSNPNGYTVDLIGIGTTDGTQKQAETDISAQGNLLLKEYSSSLNETNEFVFAAHNGTPHGIDNSDLPDVSPITLTNRWARVYYLQRVQNGVTDAGSTDLSIGFNFAGTGITPNSSKVYYLLYRSGTTGTFSVVPNGYGLVNNNKVWFNLTSANFQSGYYTIVESSQDVRTWYSFNDGLWSDFNTWSLNPDYPNNPAFETPGNLDRVVILNGKTVTVSAPVTAGTLEVNNGKIDFGTLAPSSFSSIWGQPGGIVRLAADNFPNGDATGFVSSGGGTVVYYGTGYTLNAARAFNNVEVELSSSSNTLTLLANYTLAGNLRIKNGILRINNDVSTTALTLDVSGDVIVDANGQIKVGLGNTVGSYSIASNNIPTVGQYHSISHQFKIGGNLTNNGIVKLTNQTAPVYNEFSSTGAVTLTFYGNSNATFQINGTTDLYELIVDKGSDRTFILEVYSNNYNNFRLFGPNNVGRATGGSYTAANPEVRKALWIKNGTLKLTGSINIPTLSEGNAVSGNGDYPIPANGKLWIAGPDVKVYSTANNVSQVPAGSLGVNTGSSNQALSVYGEFEITAGYFNTRNSAGFIFWSEASAVVKISGGLCDVAQFRSAHGGTGGKTSFIISGGELMVRGNRQFTWNTDFQSGYEVNPDGGGEITGAYPTFGIIDPDGVFQMTGGKIYVAQASGTNNYNSNAFLVNSDPSNHTATGGTVYFLMNDGDNFDLISSGPLYNVETQKTTGTTQANIHMGSDISLNGSLTLNSYTTLRARREHSSYNYRTYNLEVARIFIINPNAQYLAYDNTTTLLVTYTSSFSINNPELVLNNLVVRNNPNSPNTRLNFSGSFTTLTLNNLTIESGAVLRHTNQNIVVKGNISNSGTIELDNPATNTGKVLLTNRGIVSAITVTNPGSHTTIPTITISGGGGTGATAVPVFSGIPAAGNALPLLGIVITNAGTGYTSAPTVTISSGGATATATINTQHQLGGNGNGVVANLEVNEPHPSEASGKVEVTYLIANQTVSNRLTLTNGIIDLRSKLLTLDGSLSTEVITDYSTTKMIRTLGKHSDLGMRRRISGNATYIYPFGVYTKTGDGNRYTPSSNAITVFVDSGYVQVNPVDAELPTLAPSAQSALQYYWRIRHDGFTTLPRIYNIFYFYNTPASYYPGVANPSSWRPGKVVGVNRIYDLGPLNWDNDSKNLSLEYQYQDANRTGNTPPILQEGEFTTGHNTRFAGTVEVFYLRANGDWRNNNTWSYTRGGPAVPAGRYPMAGDIAVIRRLSTSYSGLVEITNAEAAAKVIFDDENGFSSGCPRLWFSTAASFNSNFFAVEVAETHKGGTLNYETHGAVMQFDLFTGYAGQFPTGDFGDFFNYPNALIIYRNEGTTNPVTLPSSVTEYPQVWFDPPNAKTFILPNTKVTFHGLVIIPYGHELQFNSGSNASATFEKRLDIGHSFGSGIVSFPGTASADQTVTAMSNIRLINNSQLRIINPTGGGRTHKLIAQKSISLETGCSINLGDGNPSNTNVTLELAGASTDSLYAAGTASVSLSRLAMNKGETASNQFKFNWPFTLTGPSNGATSEKALLLQSGTLVLNHPSIDIDINSGGEDFEIPSTAGLLINQGTIRVTNPGNSGIKLDGFLGIEGEGANQGRLILDGGVGSNNYIEYSSSGKAQIDVKGGYLEVGSQIRSSTLNNLGVLRYRQLAKSGAPTSNVIVGTRSAPINNRGVFEVMNPGSLFQLYNGTLTIVRGHDDYGTESRAALYLDPETFGTNQWPTIQIGLNGTTPTTIPITINSTKTLPRLTIDQNTLAKLSINNLSVQGNMEIRSGASFNGNNLNLTLLNNLTNNGVPNVYTNTLNFEGSEQTISGSVIANHVTINPTISVTLNSGALLTVNGDLNISSGILSDGQNIIDVKGDVYNNSYHISPSNTTGGLRFNGTTTQRIYGDGQFGRIEIDNPNKVYLENSITLNSPLKITNGIFHIQYHKLNLGLNANIEGSGFSNSKMIAVYGGMFTPSGVSKVLPTLSGSSPTDPYNPSDPAYTWNITLPIGADDGTNQRYMPVDIYLANNSSGGSLRIVPVNTPHPTFTDPGQTDHVLNQYWEVESTGISQFTALTRMHYTTDAVKGSEVDYIGASLYDGYWSKFLESTSPPIVVVDEDNDWINFIHNNQNLVSGDYTAGEPDYIPDRVPLFYSKKNGDWTDPTTWDRDDGGPVPVNGPVGQRVQIRTEHTVTIPTNYIRSYETTINGRLELGSTINHILGYVKGYGTLSSYTNSIPTGNYTNFFSCGGGTMEYGGTTDYTLTDRYTSYNNLTITGSGIKSLPSNKNISICNNLAISGTATLNTTNNYSLTVGGNITKGATANFYAEYPNQTTVLNGTLEATVSGDFTGTTQNRFNNLIVSKNTTLNGPVDVYKYLTLENNAIVYTSQTNLLRLTNASYGLGTISAGSYVEGPLSINKTNGTSQDFPIGRNGRKKITSFLNVNHGVGENYWAAEYYNSNLGSGYYDATNFDSPITNVSLSEYWVLKGPSGASSTLRFTLNGTSDIAAALGNGNLSNLRVVRWNPSTSKWEIVGTNVSITGTVSNGTVTTTSSVTFDGTNQYFTLASVQLIVAPTAHITSNNASICEGTAYNLTIELTGNAPWTISYTDGTNTYSNVVINSSPASIPQNLAIGNYTFQITSLVDKDNIPGTIYGSNPVVTVYKMPLTTFNLSNTGNICGGITSNVLQDGSENGFNYSLYINGVPYGITLAGTGSNLTYSGVDQAGIYTVRAFNQLNPSCGDWLASSTTIFLGSTATAEIKQLLTSPNACENNEVQLRLEFTGTPPFSFTISDNHGHSWNRTVALGELTGTGPYTFNYTIPDNPTWISPAAPPTVYTYTITSISDDSGCGAGTVIGSGVSVNVYKIPETGPQYHVPNNFSF